MTYVVPYDLPTCASTVTSRSRHRLLVLGSERSGSTWIAQVLCRASNAQYVHEPDNPGFSPAARDAQALGIFPVLCDRVDGRGALTAPSVEPTGDISESLQKYDDLWELAFSGRWPIRQLPRWTENTLHKVPKVIRPSVRRAGALSLSALRRVQLVASNNRMPHTDAATPLLVKSVHGNFAAEWIVRHHQPSAVVLVCRNPVAIASSLIEFGTGPSRIQQIRAVYEHPTIQERFVSRLHLPPLPVRLSVPEACAWWGAFCNVYLHELRSTHPDWILADHDAITAAPDSGFQKLFNDLGFSRTVAVDRFLSESNRPGQGFTTQRLTATASDRWRHVLGDHEAEVLSVTRSFPEVSDR